MFSTFNDSIEKNSKLLHFEFVDRWWLTVNCQYSTANTKRCAGLNALRSLKFNQICTQAIAFNRWVKILLLEACSIQHCKRLDRLHSQEAMKIYFPHSVPTRVDCLSTHSPPLFSRQSNINKTASKFVNSEEITKDAVRRCFSSKNRGISSNSIQVESQK